MSNTPATGEPAVGEPAVGEPALLRGAAWVAAGAVGGMILRSVVTAVTGRVLPDGQMWVILGINVLGAFLLGVLRAALGPRRPLLYLAVGTGVLGGFTTYSAFAAPLVPVSPGAVPVVVGDIAATLVLGPVAALLGLAVPPRLLGYGGLGRPRPLGRSTC